MILGECVGEGPAAVCGGGCREGSIQLDRHYHILSFHVAG